MILHPPFVISPRLLPALEVGEAYINAAYSLRPGREGRTRYQYILDLPDGSEHAGDDLQSGCQGGTLQKGFASLLSFLSAAGESYRYNGEEGENASLFPLAVVQWAAEHGDELSSLCCEIEESTTPLIEE